MKPAEGRVAQSGRAEGSRGEVLSALGRAKGNRGEAQAACQGRADRRTLAQAERAAPKQRHGPCQTGGTHAWCIKGNLHRLVMNGGNNLAVKLIKKIKIS